MRDEDGVNMGGGLARSLTAYQRNAIVFPIESLQPVPSLQEVFGVEILLVEDEVSIGDVLQMYFRNEGWNVHTTRNGLEALKLVRSMRFDFIILDLMLPGMTGEDVCRNIRQFSKVPIIMLTSKAHESDAINGLNLGADDYITKPYRVKELIARIHAVKRRIDMMTDTNQTMVTFNRGRFIVNFESKEVIVDGRAANLTLTEFKVLDVLVRNPGKLFSRFDLAYEVHGYRFVGDGRVMDAHIKNIRKKIETDPKNPEYIITRIGAGYKFNYWPDGN